MEQYKERLRKRVEVLSILIIACSTIMLVLYRFIFPDITLSPMVEGFQIGIFLAIEIALIFRVGKYRRAIKNQEYRKRLYIHETDERRIHIKQSMGGPVVIGVYGMLIFATMLSGFVGDIVFYTMLATTACVGLVIGSLKFYNMRKFNG